MPSYYCAFGCQNKYFFGCKAFHRCCQTRHWRPHRLSLRYRHLTPEARNYRPAVVLIRSWINQDCHLHGSTLLLNLNCSDSVSNINFYAAPNTNKLKCFDSTRRWPATQHWNQKLKNLRVCTFLTIFLVVAHFSDQLQYASGFYDVKCS